jgi:hypothetical protein
LRKSNKSNERLVNFGGPFSEAHGSRRRRGSGRGTGAVTAGLGPAQIEEMAPRCRYLPLGWDLLVEVLQNDAQTEGPA